MVGHIMQKLPSPVHRFLILLISIIIRGHLIYQMHYKNYYFFEPFFTFIILQCTFCASSIPHTVSRNITQHKLNRKGDISLECPPTEVTFHHTIPPLYLSFVLSCITWDKKVCHEIKRKSLRSCGLISLFQQQ